ncbi:MAG TPA: hypothetical protein VFC19_51865 [Candidatus Limnocylindrales bacterium]|nr:hypothetical protein [Candidatus Limnocylindrales bacterium]
MIQPQRRNDLGQAMIALALLVAALWIAVHILWLLGACVLLAVRATAARHTYSSPRATPTTAAIWSLLLAPHLAVVGIATTITGFAERPDHPLAGMALLSAAAATGAVIIAMLSYAFYQKVPAWLSDWRHAMGIPFMKSRPDAADPAATHA